MTRIDLAHRNDTKYLDYRKDARSPEKTFNGFCKGLEVVCEKGMIPKGLKTLDGLPVKEIFRRHSQMPVVMFDGEKAQKVLDWEKTADAEGIYLPFHACMVADPFGVVCFENAAVVDRAEGMKIDAALFSTLGGQYGYLNEFVISEVISFLQSPYENRWVGSILFGLSLSTYDALLKKCTTDILYSPKGLIMIDEGSSRVIPEQICQSVSTDHGGNIRVSIAQLQYLAQPGRYILKECLREVRDASSPKIRRIHERPRIISVDPEQMKTIYVSKLQGSHASPMPHLRIGHWRELHDEKFKHKRGQKIWIDEMKVKADEKWEHQGKVYKVMEMGG